MAEPYGLSRSLARLLLPLAFLALLSAILVTGPASALTPVRPSISTEAPLPVPGAFRLSASNGYTVYVIAAPPRGDSSSYMLIYASARGKGVFYKAPAMVAETSMQSDLGELGQISVSFHRTAQPTSASCGKETVRFDSGKYEGAIDFHGEEGYTNVEATTAPGNIDYLLSVACGGVFFGGGPSGRARGASLSVRNPALGPELSVSKSRPGAVAEITASTSEYSNGILSERFLRLRMPSKGFSYDRRLRTATVRPPRPFAGRARFDLGKKAAQRWSGDLTVDLPGRARVPLTGPALRATLSPTR